MPQLTVKAIVTGVLLSIILSWANAYIGLFAGLTVSASIPAAVLSMAVLSLFKRSNILEHNIVQTAASAGESLAGRRDLHTAGVADTQTTGTCSTIGG